MNKQRSHIKIKSQGLQKTTTPNHLPCFLIDYSVAPNVLNSINLNLPCATEAVMSVSNCIRSHGLTHSQFHEFLSETEV